MKRLSVHALSLLATWALQRVAVAIVLVAGLWLAVAWALH